MGSLIQAGFRFVRWCGPYGGEASFSLRVCFSNGGLDEQRDEGSRHLIRHIFQQGVVVSKLWDFFRSKERLGWLACFILAIAIVLLIARRLYGL